MTDIEARLQQIEDIEAIRHLKHYYYCHCVDLSVAGNTAAIEETTTRFADGIVADFSGLPLAEGKEAVSAFYVQGVPAFLSYSQHRVMNEVITIGGDTATAIWYLDCPVVFKPGNPTGMEGAGIIMGRYEEEYVRQDGVWKWKKIVALLDVQNTVSGSWQNAQQLLKNR